MLQFWKKSGSKDKVEKTGKNVSPSRLAKSSPIHQPFNGDVSDVPSFHSSSANFLSELNDEDLAASISGLWRTPRSQLSKSLAEVLSDKGALGYFIQFLEAQGKLSLIKFWMDVESFRAAASTRNVDSVTPVTPVTREQLGLLDNPSRLSPQRSLGTDCDSLLESPSHSIDSCDSTCPETINNQITRTSYNKVQEITNILTSKGTDRLECNDSTSVHMEVNQMQNSNKTSDFITNLSPLSTANATGDQCVQSSNSTVDVNEQAICDSSGLVSNRPPGLHAGSDSFSASTHNPNFFNSSQGTDKSRHGLKLSENILQLKDVSNSSITYNLSSTDSSLSHRSVEVNGVLTTDSGSESSLSNTTCSLAPLNKKSEKSSVISYLCGNIQQAVIEDAVRIYGKYLSLGCVFKVPIDNEIKERVISAVCKEDGLVSSEAFTEAQSVIFCIMERDYFHKFLRSDFHCKHQIDVLTSGKVTMADILYNETALFYFMEFMEQEGNRHLVEFWLAAINFQQHLVGKKGIYDPIEAQNDAIILYDKYFSLQATCPLGFGDQVRFAVEQDICRDEGPLPDCFQRPVFMVQHALQKNFLQQFLSSQLHFKYLSELMNTIQASPALLTKNRKSGSECSSDWSISVQNTLLAAEDSIGSSNRALQSVGARDLSIDSHQLNDPDLLWKRRHHRGLNFGRINHMGRFETDVEPEPDRKEESRITKVVKKLVNMEEDKAKEEMAWQIAEMIINDITSLTLGSGESVQS